MESNREDKRKSYIFAWVEEFLPSAGTGFSSVLILNRKRHIILNGSQPRDGGA